MITYISVVHGTKIRPKNGHMNVSNASSTFKRPAGTSQ
jgi:hypothetical protein